MSIFGKIASAIFGTAAHADTLPKGDAGNTAPAATPAPATPAGYGKVASADTPSTPSASSPASSSPAAAAAKPGAAVDVAAVLDGMDSDEDLDWRKSIVDLMKLLKLDSSLKSRKELATELKYTGDMSDSASMNIWLHKQVMTKLAENGGKVPAGLGH